jgi:hypothetical protein
MTSLSLFGQLPTQEQECPATEGEKREVDKNDSRFIMIKIVVSSLFFLKLSEWPMNERY